MINLTQKERMLLEDQKKHEQVCVQKYNEYASKATDPQLKQLFTAYAQQEQTHYDTINQILNGQLPAMGGGQGRGLTPLQGGVQPGAGNPSDAALCNDMLMTEKYVSDTYNTAIFEFRDSNIRNILNHIQKEEQQHGEGIFNYMSAKGMYNP
ncbi:Spore coat protein CotF [Thermosyntropha lipolytica DSM 11003]|uniref:Spore coat protein CotF n=1 Tax=Thermosyntropha lipolytica DSM 11003 TaxID=1123382 RepID=A0A1M5KJ28_9FIRM|nr:spore coat protein [Thermosyntropha lipolytica]SHG52715.1 Spore coat protein CotF [Thermosyntropha lipolytica DSM 11003]